MSTSSLSPKRPQFLTVPRALVLGALLVALLVLLLLLSPAEQQLGNLIKIIYLHGALARTGMAGLMIAGLLGLVYLIRPRPGLLRWSNALQVAAMILFVVHFLLSIIPTYATWGMWIAFDEPRTRMSLQIIGVGAIVILVRYLLNDNRLSALANGLLGAAVLLLDIRTGVLRHPLNPIGDSTSATIQGFYLAIVATCFGLLFLLAWLLTQRTMRLARGPESSPQSHKKH
jgi:hypothetical protein